MYVLYCDSISCCVIQLEATVQFVRLEWTHTCWKFFLGGGDGGREGGIETFVMDVILGKNITNLSLYLYISFDYLDHCRGFVSW